MTPDQSRTAQLYRQNPRKAAPRLEFLRSILISPPIDGRQPHDRPAGKRNPAQGRASHGRAVMARGLARGDRATPRRHLGNRLGLGRAPVAHEPPWRSLDRRESGRRVGLTMRDRGI